jgi:hypothetical protein
MVRWIIEHVCVIMLMVRHVRVRGMVRGMCLVGKSIGNEYILMVTRMPVMY